MQIIHNYAENGEYLSSTEAIESPLEPGIFLIPRNATTTAPPESQSGFARVFVNGEWSQVLDKRGSVYWLSYTESHTITELGQDIPEGAMIDQPAAPAAPDNPEPTKADLIAQLAALQAKIEGLPA